MKKIFTSSKDATSSNILKNKSKYGHTLHEIVMLTATASVIIATAIAIPIILHNYQKSEYVTALEKAYTEFNQALAEMSVDKGCVDDLQCTGLFAKGTSDKTFGDTLVKYFKIKKNCGTTPGKGCFPNKTKDSYDASAATFYDLDTWDGYRFITADGAAYYVWNYVSNCEENYSTGETRNLTQACGEIYVDVNGPKNGPNTMGRDTFNLWISNGKGALLYPMGGIDTNWSAEDWRWRNPDDSNKVQHCYPKEKTGWPCAGRIIEEGWKMNY